MTNKKNQSRNADGRTRNWTFILYPESAPTDWKDILQEMHIEVIISPLHNKDTNPDGEIKKAHYHVLLMFPSVKSYQQVLDITKQLNASVPQQARSAKGVVRYMLHLDNPEKYQYEQKDIITFGGADVLNLLKPTATDRYQLINEMRQFVADNNITEFIQLFDYAAEARFDDWFPLLCDNSAYVIGQYIKSNRHRPRKENQED